MKVKRALHREHFRAVALTAAGTSLIAATYGMARFGVGLLHPAMANDRPGIAPALAWAGVAQFSSYCLAAGLAALLVPRRSRVVAGAAGTAAGIGCLGLAFSTTAGWFVLSAFVGGAGAGLASPALVGLLDAVVPARSASTAQAVVNCGTSVGVVVAGVLATVVTAPTLAWLLMGALSLATATAVVVLTSGTASNDARSRRSAGVVPGLALPVVSALAAGFVSAATWTYGPTAVVTRGALEPDQVGILWAALGVGGLSGAFVAVLVARCGPDRSFLVCSIALLVTSSVVLAPIVESPWWTLTGAAGFGGAYMSLSGVLILWGRRLDSRRGAAVTAWLFVALAVGQAVGAQVLGSVVT